MPYIDSSQKILPWQSGSDTSHDAAVRAKNFAGAQGQRYYFSLLYRGRTGFTDYEAEMALGMRRSSICARRNELIVAGLVERVKDARRDGCAVWRARRIDAE